jgi:hypothetical protein
VIIETWELDGCLEAGFSDPEALAAQALPSASEIDELTMS